MMHRRQKRQVVVASILAVIAVVNILFFLILLRPARSDYFNLQGSIDQIESQMASSKLTKVRLEKTSEQLERFEQDRDTLFTKHFIEFDPGFAELSPRLEQMAIQSGVLRPVVDYSREEIKKYGLYSVKIKIPVTGTYSNAVNFIKNLETSDTFFLIDSIDVQSKSDGAAASAAATPAVASRSVLTPNSVPVATPNSAATVGLSLSLETFFYK